MTDNASLQTSNHLLAEPLALRERLDRDGYLYIKQLVNADTLKTLQAQVMDILHRHHWLDPATDTTRIAPANEGEEEYFKVYDEVQKLETFHALPHSPEIMSLMRAAVGETAFPHPLSIARLSFPDNAECTTPPHQDYPNNQGTRELFACWMPLSDCPQQLGGLAVLPGSHKLGLMPLEFSLGPGGRQARLSPAARELQWHTADFRAGDALVFGSMTIHRALPNLSGNRMRLSVDYRYQQEHQALTEGVLKPHFSRLDWEDIYRGWQTEELKYYWRQKAYNVVPWDPAMHQLPDGHMGDAISQRQAYNARRASTNPQTGRNGIGN